MHTEEHRGETPACGYFPQDPVIMATCRNAFLLVRARVQHKQSLGCPNDFPRCGYLILKTEGTKGFLSIRNCLCPLQKVMLKSSDEAELQKIKLFTSTDIRCSNSHASILSDLLYCYKEHSLSLPHRASNRLGLTRSLLTPCRIETFPHHSYASRCLRVTHTHDGQGWRTPSFVSSRTMAGFPGGLAS
jgi:hypothetical protein